MDGPRLSNSPCAAQSFGILSPFSASFSNNWSSIIVSLFAFSAKLKTRDKLSTEALKFSSFDFSDKTFASNVNQLFSLSPTIDHFFNHTMVMTEDEKRRDNRLALLASLVEKASQIAQFNQINTK